MCVEAGRPLILTDLERIYGKLFIRFKYLKSKIFD